MCDKRTNHQEILECKKLEDLKDYCEPSASGNHWLFYVKIMRILWLGKLSIEKTIKSCE